MNDTGEQALERLLQRELKELPDLQAPETLFHHVMLAVHERAGLPWWRCSWQGWPPGFQAFALVLLIGMAASVSYLTALTIQAADLSVLTTAIEPWLDPVRSGWEVLGTVVNAAFLVFKAGGQQVLLWGAVLVFGIYFACVGLGSACARVAYGKG
jgi:hypothetical protein